ncbi:MAG: hypothetical protein NVS2B1_16550 [Bradyrhizobium sp.]
MRVHSRADILRTGDVVVALFLTAIPTSAVARKFRAACPRSGDDPTIQARGSGQTKRIRKVE